MPKKQPAKPDPSKTNPGPTKPTELNERVRECRVALENHFTKGEIKRMMHAKYGVTARTVEGYLKTAREEILLEISDTRDFYRSQSLAVYREVIKNKNSTVKDRMFAQRQIDHLLGLHAPWKVAQTDAQGHDVPPDEARDRLSALFATITERDRNAGIDRLPKSGGARVSVNGPRGRKRKAAE